MLLALAAIAILQMEKSAYIAERQSAMAIPFMTFAVIKIFKTKLFPCLHTENTELYEECCACFFPMQKDSASFGNPWTLNKWISCFKTLKLPPRRIRQLNHQLRFCLQHSHFGTSANKTTRACSKSCQTAS